MSSEDEIRFQFLAENSIDVICRAGMDMVLHYVSPSCFHVLGWQPEEMIGRRPDAFVFSEGDSQGSSPDLDNSPATIRMRKKDGLIAWIEIKHRVVGDSSTGDPKETIIVMRDITERKTLEERLSELALTDSLTGLSTPRAFDEALEREWNRTQREGSCISLLLLHFNDFGQFHDWQAHLEGDPCLATAAAAVIAVLRITDFAARYGAEDIAIILPGTSPVGAAKVAEKVRSVIEPLRSALKRKTEGHGWAAVSIGISTVLARSSGTLRVPEILVLAADSALQRAKRQNTESRGRRAASCPSGDTDWKMGMPSTLSRSA